MLALLITAAATMRRLFTGPSVALAIAAGALAGLLVTSLPDGELALEIFTGLLHVLAAILVLPLVAGVITADRQGGYEQLVARWLANGRELP